MRKTSFFYRIRRLIPMMACVGLLFSAVHNSLLAQTTTEEEIVVTAEEVPSAYGAPPGLSRSRFSNTVNAYVLPPWSFCFGELYEGQGFRHGPPDHLFTQEIEMGLPWRFNVVAVAQFERSNGGGGAQTVSLEARWALADWNKTPLNPTIFAEYKNVTTKDTRGDSLNSFVIGPTVAWKPTAQTRLDVSPLFGCTHDSPVADVFVAFSWLFGGERAEAEAPVSSRFRYYSDASYSSSVKDSGKEMKQVAYVPPCPQWYGDREWNVNLWGTYAFTNTEFAPNPSLVDIVQSTSEGNPVLGTYDRYIGGDHAWGGGGDIKYFFCRYVGLGVEGFALDASKPGFDIFEDPTVPIFIHRRINHDHTIGSVLGTLTLRYPIPCTRLAPYTWAGVGAIFGGGERDIVHTQGPPDAFAVHAETDHFGSETKVVGQFGAGLEVRFSRHIGWTNDLSFGVIDGPQNNFGMFRSGLNFAF